MRVRRGAAFTGAQLHAHARTRAHAHGRLGGFPATMAAAWSRAERDLSAHGHALAISIGEFLAALFTLFLDALFTLFLDALFTLFLDALFTSAHGHALAISIGEFFDALFTSCLLVHSSLGVRVPSALLNTPNVNTPHASATTRECAHLTGAPARGTSLNRKQGPARGRTWYRKQGPARGRTSLPTWWRPR